MWNNNLFALIKLGFVYKYRKWVCKFNGLFQMTNNTFELN